MSRPTLAWGILAAVLAACGAPGARGVDPRPLSVNAGGNRDRPAADGADRPALPPTAIEFVRVNAAATAIDDLPLDAGRSIPMPLAEFNAALAAIGVGPGSRFQPSATTASYDLTTAPDGGLVGEVSFEVGDLQGAVRTAMPLGAIAAERCLVRTAAGTGEAAVFGLPDGRVAVQIVGPGTYRCGIRLPPLQAGRLNRVPLVSALVTQITLELPAGVRPVVVGDVAAAALVEPLATADGWRIVTAAAGELPLTIQDSRRTPPAVTCWNHVSLRGRQADVATRIVPLAGWTATDLELSADPALVPTGVRDDSGRDVPWTGQPGRLHISIPERLIGNQMPLVVTGIVPVAESGSQPVPDWRPHRSRWAGAGTQVVTDAAFAVEAMELDQCLVVTPTDAAAWPLPTAAEAVRPFDSPAAGCRLFLEHQSPAATARIAVGPRTPAFDTARVTTVDVSPGTVLGRAACDVRVVAGEVFSLTATVAPGWFIDSVEAVDWQRSLRPRQGKEPVDSALDWRVVRSSTGNELRIGLAAAASSARRLGLLITGHRPGVPLGSRFSLAELDMVRLPGESPELSLLEFRVGPMAVVETEGETLPVEPATGRLAPLAAESAPRARVRAGDQAPPMLARLVRRRPPVDAEVRVGLMARDERVAETFAFTCHPVAGEIDAVVVHFSEPMSTGLEWTLLEPVTGSLAARRLDPGEAAMGAAMPDLGVAESWLVDVRPATAGTVRFTATRTVAMEAVVPVPLAWVEGAEHPGGRVTITGEAGQRPELLNRRLREVPPTDDDGGPAAVLLAYGAAERVAATGGAAADLLPPATASGARAWAWKESITCQCHDSGMLEWESRLDIENQGRASVSLTVPDGLRLEAVSVAGSGIGAAEVGQAGGTLVVPLPAERGRVSLVISGTGARDNRFGWWSLGAIACGIDLPILNRDARLLLPPGLALFSGHGAPRDSWAGRLFQATLRDGSPAAEARSVDITASTRAGVTSAVVVRRRLITSAALLAGGLAILAGWRLVGRRPVAAIVSCAAAGLLALWLAAPWDAIARMVWWGSIVGIWFAAWQGGLRGPAASGWFPRALFLLGVGCLEGSAFGEEPELAETRPLRVIVSEEPGGGMALVPEVLFRRLADAEAAVAVPAVRVVRAEVRITAERDVWQLWLALDADRGGTLRLPTDPGSHWLTDVDQAIEGSLAVAIGADHIQFFSPEGGRAEITLRYEPKFVPDGAVEAAVLLLPPTAAARVVVSARAAGETDPGWQCDRSEAKGPWLPAVWTGDEFDVSRAARIRIVRPALSTDLLVAQPRVADSVNDVSWRSTECRVDASFTVGGEAEIVRRLVLRADAGLLPVVGAAGFESLGDGRYQVDFVQPAHGPRTVTASFRMPLTDPVGVFELPGVWLEGVGTDQRTVRLRPEPGLEAAPELPRGLTLVRPRAEDGPTTAAIWRSETLAEAADAGGEAAARPRIAVRRRPVPPRGSQSLLVTVAADRISLQLDVELEAVTLPLVQIPLEFPDDAMIDRLVVTRRSEGGEALEPAEIDTVWSRSATGRLAVVVQRPDTGLFHLRLAARLPGPPPGSGRMPLVRADLDGGLPLAVRWQAVGGLTIDLPGQAGAVGEPRQEWLEIPAGEPGPAYELVRESTESSGEAPVAAVLPAVAVDVGVALTDVHLAIDHRGRGWGLARFDLVAAEPTLQLELPKGLRLFDVRVDGREVTAMPRADSIWEVRLHDVTWPRTLVALFAGSVSGPLSEGKPIRLVPPRIVGLSAADVIWSLDVPAGYTLRSGESVTPLDSLVWQVGAERNRQWYGEAFQAAIAAVGPEEREWLEAFAVARRAGTAPAGETAWYEAWSSAAAELTGHIRLDAGSEGTVTVRPVAVRDATTAARGLASLGLVVAVGSLWAVGRRMSAAGWQAVARWWWTGCGLAWMALLQPTLPGWLMLGVGLWVAFGARNRRQRDAAA